MTTDNVIKFRLNEIDERSKKHSETIHKHELLVQGISDNVDIIAAKTTENTETLTKIKEYFHRAINEINNKPVPML